MKGKTLGSYEIRDELGRGGMGVVYRAYQSSLNRSIAVKVLPENLVHDQELVERFLREARSAAALDHPNIVTIHDVGSEGDTYYFAMQFLEGTPLDKWIKRDGALPLDKALTILAQIADALSYAHHKGIIHRDIKPGNIIVDDKDRAVLMDFGIARAMSESRLTRTGLTVGSPEYMSPEQVSGHDTDSRSDLYALGVVFYEMLTGEVPYKGDTAVAVAYQHVNGPIRSPLEVQPGLPPAVDALACKLMAKNPEDRFQDAGDIVAALSRSGSRGASGIWTVKLPELGDGDDGNAETLLGTPTLTAGSESSLAALRKTLSGRMIWVLGVVLSILGLVLIAAGYSYFNREELPEKKAEREIPEAAEAQRSTAQPDSESTPGETPAEGEAVMPTLTDTAGSLEPAGMAMLVVRSNLSGDLLFLDGIEVGATPQTLEISAGEHTVEVTKEQCKPSLHTITLRPDEQRELQIRMLCPDADRDAATVFLREASGLYEEGRHQEALQACDRALARQPDRREAIELKERITRTLSVLQSRTADDPAAHLATARELFQLGKYEEALQLCRRALQIDPESQQALELQERIERTIAVLRGDS